MTATLSCVDVGHGDCTVAVDDDGGDALLIDCREGKHRLAVEELKRLGFTQLRSAIVTHTHFDHFGGVLDVLEEIGDQFTGTLYFNQDSFMSVPVAGEERGIAGRKLRALLLRAREFVGRVERAETGAGPEACGSINWQLLAPTYGEVISALTQADANLASGIVVVRVESDVVVIGGDAQMVTWKRVASQIPKGSVVRWPHHGGNLGSAADDQIRLLEILEPSAVIVSVGATNTHGHPSDEFFAAAGGRAGWLLCTQATPTCVSGAGTGGVCAGTVRIELGKSEGPVLNPDTPDHVAVIAALGNAQCLKRNALAGAEPVGRKGPHSE